MYNIHSVVCTCKMYYNKLHAHGSPANRLCSVFASETRRDWPGGIIIFMFSSVDSDVIRDTHTAAHGSLPNRCCECMSMR